MSTSRKYDPVRQLAAVFLLLAIVVGLYLWTESLIVTIAALLVFAGERLA